MSVAEKEDWISKDMPLLLLASKRWSQQLLSNNGIVAHCFGRAWLVLYSLLADGTDHLYHAAAFRVKSRVQGCAFWAASLPIFTKRQSGT